LTASDHRDEADRFPSITEEALDDLRARIGVPITGPRPHVTEATVDAIRHFADGIGDDNPLWIDEAYAAASPHGALLAPPTMLYAFDRVTSGYIGGLPGIHAMYAGTDFRWHRPVRLGDRLTATPAISGVRDMASRFSGRSVLQTYHVPFHDQHGELVAEVESWVIRTQRDAARRRAERPDDAAPTLPTTWSRDQIEEIAGAYRAERRRGAEPRYWEDVAIGDPLDERLKGPMTVTSFIAFDLGWGGLYIKAHAGAFAMYDAHPALGIPNDLGVPEPPERVHWDSGLARAVGVPGAYDYGPERISWMGHLMTDWIGDHGRLLRLNVQVRSHNIVGDLTRCQGRVIDKQRDGDTHLVTCEVWGVNQHGQRNAVGTAVAALPMKGA